MSKLLIPNANGQVIIDRPCRINGEQLISLNKAPGFDSVRILARGVTVTDCSFGGGNSEAATVHVVTGASVTFQDCQFHDAPGVLLFRDADAELYLTGCMFLNAGDNGVQIENHDHKSLSQGFTMINCAIVGNFGNRAFFSSHQRAVNMLIDHNTIIAENGYGVLLANWILEEAVPRNLVFRNNLVLAAPTGAGADGYSVLVTVDGLMKNSLVPVDQLRNLGGNIGTSSASYLMLTRTVTYAPHRELSWPSGPLSEFTQLRPSPRFVSQLQHCQPSSVLVDAIYQTMPASVFAQCAGAVQP